MLSEVLAPKQIKEDAESLQIWGKDWTNGFVVAPSAIVFPESIEQLQDLVAHARSHDLKLVPSGGRTGLSGGAVASQGEVVVSFDRMNQILDFSPEDRIVTCQPGVITANLQAFAAEQGSTPWTLPLRVHRKSAAMWRPMLVALRLYAMA